MFCSILQVVAIQVKLISDINRLCNTSIVKPDTVQIIKKITRTSNYWNLSFLYLKLHIYTSQIKYIAIEFKSLTN